MCRPQSTAETPAASSIASLAPPADQQHADGDERYGGHPRRSDALAEEKAPAEHDHQDVDARHHHSLPERHERYECQPHEEFDDVDEDAHPQQWTEYQCQPMCGHH